MDRVALIARLKPGTEEQAAQLVAAGPPFDPGDRGLSRHVVYLSAGEVVFVFEGDEVEWIVEDMVAGRRKSPRSSWRALDGPPDRAPRYTWRRRTGQTARRRP